MPTQLLICTKCGDKVLVLKIIVRGVTELCRKCWEAKS